MRMDKSKGTLIDMQKNSIHWVSGTRIMELYLYCFVNTSTYPYQYRARIQLAWDILVHSFLQGFRHTSR